MHCYVEVSSADEDFDVEDFEIKLNLYDSDGDICAVHGESSYEFTGYDTFDIWISGFSKIQSTVASARLYVKKQ